MFSKIDLRSGYHQLVLHPSCCYITIFATHVGLFRYKRLSFGINAAAEVFQHAIQSVIQDVPGSLNISDDIVVFGTDIESHDKALDQVLHRLQDAGLTVNLDECEFKKTFDRILWYDLFGRWHLPGSKEGGGSEEITQTKECVKLR